MEPTDAECDWVDEDEIEDTTVIFEWLAISIVYISFVAKDE